MTRLLAVAALAATAITMTGCAAPSETYPSPVTWCQDYRAAFTVVAESVNSLRDPSKPTPSFVEGSFEDLAFQERDLWRIGVDSGFVPATSARSALDPLWDPVVLDINAAIVSATEYPGSFDATITRAAALKTLTEAQTDADRLLIDAGVTGGLDAFVDQYANEVDRVCQFDVREIVEDIDALPVV
jgi:hypothetical protein